MPIIAPRTRNRLLLGLFILGLAVLTNWIFAYELVDSVQTDKVYKDRMLSTQYLDANFGLKQQELGIEGDFRAGGWPCKYYYSKVAPNGVVLSAMDWMALAINVAVWFGIFLLLLGYELFLNRKRSTEAEQPTGPRRLSLGDLLIVISGFAVMLMYGRHVYTTGQQHNEIANRIVEKGGSVERIAYLPIWLRNRIPESAHGSLLRLTRAEMIQPKSEELAEVLELGTLEELYLSGGGYDLRLLDDLKAQTALVYLRVAGRELDPQFIAAVGSAKQLRCVSLIYTNVTEDALESFGEMPVLRSLDLANTDVELQSDTPPKLATNLKAIVLPSGSGAGHQLVGWPELRRLEIHDMDTIQTNRELQVSLRDLPELIGAVVDTGYLTSFSGENLPNLRTVGAKSNGLAMVADGQRAAFHPRFESVKLVGVPALEELSIDAERLGYFEFIDTPKLEFELSFKAYTRYVGRYDSGEREGSELSIQKRQEWIDSFANCEGLRTANLQGLALEDLDLTPIAQCPTIENVIVSGTGIKAPQIADLRIGDHIRRIDARGCEIGGADLEKLLSVMPQLQELLVSSEQLGRLRIKGNANIESVIGRRMPGYFTTDALQLENVPRLNEVFDLAPGAIYASVKDAPALRGLIFHSVVPKGLQLRGLRDLEIFAAGGPRLTAEHVSEVVQCKGLRKLTLAHADIDIETLKPVLECLDLEYLCLTSTTLSDEFASGLGALKKLRALRLDRTGVSEQKVIELVNQLPGLTGLGASKVTAQFANALKKLPNLQDLALRDSKIDVELMRAICGRSELRKLWLDGCEIEAEAAQFMATQMPSAVIQLSLQSATVEGDSLRSLASNRESLQWWVSDLTTDLEAMDFIMLNGRVMDQEGMLWTMWPSFGAQVFERENEDRKLGEIDPYTYSPEFTQKAKSLGGFPRMQPPSSAPLGSY